MEEQKEKREQTEEEEGEAPSAIDVAQKLHEQIKSENDRHEALIVRQEKLAAQNMLGGRSNAGQAPVAKVEPTNAEYAKSILAGEVPNE